VRDQKAEIADAVVRLKSIVGNKGFVFTSGGIGPTHDDITYESIAFALGKKMEVHGPTLEKMKVHFAKRDPPVEVCRVTFFSQNAIEDEYAAKVPTPPDMHVSRRRAEVFH
jgi:molybdopterin-biosynthesis enzyme MoeA-like protein